MQTRWTTHIMAYVEKIHDACLHTICMLARVHITRRLRIWSFNSTTYCTHSSCSFRISTKFKKPPNEVYLLCRQSCIVVHSTSDVSRLRSTLSWTRKSWAFSAYCIMYCGFPETVFCWESARNILWSGRKINFVEDYSYFNHISVCEKLSIRICFFS